MNRPIDLAQAAVVTAIAANDYKPLKMTELVNAVFASGVPAYSEFKAAEQLVRNMVETSFSLNPAEQRHLTTTTVGQGFFGIEAFRLTPAGERAALHAKGQDPEVSILGNGLDMLARAKPGQPAYLTAGYRMGELGPNLTEQAFDLMRRNQLADIVVERGTMFALGTRVTPTAKGLAALARRSATTPA
jgi:hypothetical protein